MNTWKSIDIQVLLKNLTSRTEVSKKAGIQFLDISGDEITLSLPSESCAQGHQIFLTVEITSQDKSLQFTSTGKVLGAEDAGGGVDRVKIQMIQFDRKSWESVLETMETRQAEVEALFHKIKGDE